VAFQTLDSDKSLSWPAMPVQRVNFSAVPRIGIGTASASPGQTAWKEVKKKMRDEVEEYRHRRRLRRFVLAVGISATIVLPVTLASAGAPGATHCNMGSNYVLSPNGHTTSTSHTVSQNGGCT
jgi:hypothetical protein